MKKMIFVAILGLFLAACAGPPPLPGEPLAAVKAKLGEPTATYPNGADTMLEYATAPFGQYTWMARIGPDGRLQTYEQVLTTEKFGTVKPGKDDKQSVLRILGRPVEQTRYWSVDGDVWLYRYKEADVWNSEMSVQFDRDGVVQAMVNGPDMTRESRRR